MSHAQLVGVVEVLLVEHRYSASPWRCRCGAEFDNANLAGHRAQVVVAALFQAPGE